MTDENPVRIQLLPKFEMNHHDPDAGLLVFLVNFLLEASSFENSTAPSAKYLRIV
jgi:hypothetical protein